MAWVKGFSLFFFINMVFPAFGARTISTPVIPWHLWYKDVGTGNYSICAKVVFSNPAAPGSSTYDQSVKVSAYVTGGTVSSACASTISLSMSESNASLGLPSSGTVLKIASPTIQIDAGATKSSAKFCARYTVTSQSSCYFDGGFSFEIEVSQDTGALIANLSREISATLDASNQESTIQVLGGRAF